MTFEEIKQIFEIYKAFDKEEDWPPLSECEKMRYDFSDKEIEKVREKFGKIFGLRQELFDYLLNMNADKMSLLIDIFADKLNEFKNLSKYMIFLKDGYEGYYNWQAMFRYVPLHKIGFIKYKPDSDKWEKKEERRKLEQKIIERGDKKEIEFYVKRYKCYDSRLLFMVKSENVIRNVAKRYKEIKVPYEKNNFENICWIMEKILVYNSKCKFVFEWDDEEKKEFIKYLLDNKKYMLMEVIWQQ